MNSVYCSVSNISIGYGDRCCIIPIRKNFAETVHWKIATIPIFGKYYEYGRLYEIDINENVKLLEEWFGVDVETFIEYLIAPEYCKNKFTINHSEEVDEWNYLYVCEEVWQQFTTNVYDSDFWCSAYNLDEIKLDKKFQTNVVDCEALVKNMKSIYHERILGLERFSRLTDFYYLIKKYPNIYDRTNYKKEPIIFQELYYNKPQFDVDFMKLRLFMSNLRSISKMIEPFLLGATPQDGTYDTYSKIFSEFVKINDKKYAELLELQRS